MKITPLAAGVAAIALAAVAGGAPAEAAAPFVTRDGGYALAANCPSVPDGTQCDATPYPVVFGPGTTGVTADTGIITSLFAHAEVNTSYGSAFGTASHDGALGLPVLRALADSSLAAGGRYSTTYGQATSVTALTYTGSTDTALPLLGTVNGQISGYGLSLIHISEPTRPY